MDSTSGGAGSGHESNASSRPKPSPTQSYSTPAPTPMMAYQMDYSQYKPYMYYPTTEAPYAMPYPYMHAPQIPTYATPASEKKPETRPRAGSSSAKPPATTKTATTSATTDRSGSASSASGNSTRAVTSTAQSVLEDAERGRSRTTSAAASASGRPLRTSTLVRDQSTSRAPSKTRGSVVDRTNVSMRGATSKADSPSSLTTRSKTAPETPMTARAASGSSFPTPSPSVHASASKTYSRASSPDGTGDTGSHMDGHSDAPRLGMKRSAVSQGGGSAKKQKLVADSAAKLSETERRAVFAIDPFAQSVESNRIFCKECQKWVKLGDGVRFRIKHWAGHCALVHKRDRKTASDLLERGVEEAARLAEVEAERQSEALRRAEEEAIRKAEEVAAQQKAKDQAKAAAAAEKATKTAAAARARAAKEAAVKEAALKREAARRVAASARPSPQPGKGLGTGTSTPVGAKSASKVGLPSQGGYATRARGAAMASVPRYNYEEEIPEPPTSVLPPRFRRMGAAVAVTVSQDKRASQLERLKAPGAGSPTSETSSVTRRISGKEAREQIKGIAEAERERRKDRKSGQEICSRAEILGIKPRDAHDIDTNLDYASQDMMPTIGILSEHFPATHKPRSPSPVIIGLPAELTFTGSPITEPTDLVLDNIAAPLEDNTFLLDAAPLGDPIFVTTGRDDDIKSPRRISGSFLRAHATPLDLLPLVTTPLKFSRKPGFSPDAAVLAVTTTEGAAAAKAKKAELLVHLGHRCRTAPTISDRTRYARIAAVASARAGAAVDRSARKSTSSQAGTEIEAEDFDEDFGLDEAALNSLHSRDMRRSELQRDPDVRAISVDAVQCNGCGKWFKLSIDLYTNSRWYGPKGHKRKCTFLRQQSPAGIPAAIASHVDRAAGPLEDISLSWTDEQLQDDPRVRKVAGDRVQCNDCGKWTFKPNWESHYLYRCRNRGDAVSGGPSEQSSRGATPPESLYPETALEEATPEVETPNLAAAAELPAPTNVDADVDDSSLAVDAELIDTDQPTAQDEEEEALEHTTLVSATEQFEDPRASIDRVVASERPSPSRHSSLAVDTETATTSWAMDHEDSPLTPSDGPPSPVATLSHRSAQQSRASSVAMSEPILRTTRSLLRASTSNPILTAQIAERRAKLERDVNVAEVTDEAVKCAACGTWVHLGDTLYPGRIWDGRSGHKFKCLVLKQRALENTSAEQSKQPTPDRATTSSSHHNLDDLSSLSSFDDDVVEEDVEMDESLTSNIYDSPQPVPLLADSLAGNIEDIKMEESLLNPSLDTQQANAPCIAPVIAGLVPLTQMEEKAIELMGMTELDTSPPEDADVSQAPTPASAGKDLVFGLATPEAYTVARDATPSLLISSLPPTVESPRPFEQTSADPALPLRADAGIKEERNEIQLPIHITQKQAMTDAVLSPAMVGLRDTLSIMDRATSPKFEHGNAVASELPALPQLDDVEMDYSAAEDDHSVSTPSPPAQQDKEVRRTPRASGSQSTPTPTRALRSAFRVQEEPSAPPPGPSEQDVRRSLAENPAVRAVEGDRVQCNHCGKWLSISGWPLHITARCRHRPKRRGGRPPASSSQPTKVNIPDVDRQQGASALPFNQTDVPNSADQRRRLPLILMTQEEKMALAGDFLRRTVATRIDELKNDPDVRNIGENTVQCNMCGDWVKLSNHMYAAHRWFGPFGHKSKCPEKQKSAGSPPSAT
ncbi:hypothetical protein BKA62DRAFT_701297 [Auriculariales sp. MPI-PUGE-AT-0066]|nr:hypothetical protein BKA62DRAFT_701297 [Auriculariales sp. MPI-PUGE-AT-0066]